MDSDGESIKPAKPAKSSEGSQHSTALMRVLHCTEPVAFAKMNAEVYCIFLARDEGKSSREVSHDCKFYH